MQSQSCQFFFFHIDFSTISPIDCALKGRKRMLIQHRSREHLHRGLAEGRVHGLPLRGRFKAAKKEEGKKLGSLCSCRQHTQMQCPPWHSTVNPQDQKHKPVTHLCQARNKFPPMRTYGSAREVSAALGHIPGKQHCQEQPAKQN